MTIAEDFFLTMQQPNFDTHIYEEAREGESEVIGKQ